MAKKIKNRTIQISAKLLSDHLDERLWSVEKLCRKSGVSTESISRYLRGGASIYWSTAESLQQALGLDSINKLVDQPLNVAEAKVCRVNEWLIDEVQSRWITASNQLQYRIWKLQHEHLPKLARGKFYDLEGMSTDEREHCHAALLRHAMVCTKIGTHANIIRNISTCQSDDEQGWWVIDEWIEGHTLNSLLDEGSVSRPTAIRFGIAIAEAMSVLHAHDIVRRELTPQCLIVEHESERIVLTEFELAKLLDGSPTVSTDEWMIDPYRAPEAESDDVDQRADIYSWGRVMLEILLGTLPEIGTEKVALKNFGLPQAEAKLLGRCVSVSRRSRPKTFTEILDELKEWNDGNE